MGESRAIFSCALHENLGISVMEAVLTGAVPIVPDRASYSEMYLPVFKYPTEWTSSIEQYKKHKEDLVAFISDRMDNADKYTEQLKQQQDILIKDYLNCDVMIENILK
jgi:hypothetical protein